MTVHFEADAVEIEETEFDILAVGFYTEENYLMIQQTLDGYDEQDAESGMDSYHIERDDQSFGGYGGVEKLTLRRDSIEVELDETGKENLDCEAVKADFQTDDETYQLLREKLGLIFGDLLTVAE